uniref:Uncharacterized protein n=1 Tax=Rhizophora mucronata TaxID=61149 RepID=A0A2P2QXZ9_RHIMU
MVKVNKAQHAQKGLNPSWSKDAKGMLIHCSWNLGLFYDLYYFISKLCIRYELFVKLFLKLNWDLL